MTAMLLFVVLSLICLAANGYNEYDLRNNCRLSSVLAVCSYAGAGLYNSSYKMIGIQRLKVDRLTNGQIDLTNLPDLTVLYIQSSLYDSHNACDHVRALTKPVTIIMGSVSTVCVSNGNM